MKLFRKSLPETGIEPISGRAAYSGGETGMNIAAAICAELARLVTLELEGSIVGSKRADFINESYSRIINKAYNFCEIACAIGGVILKPYERNGRIMTAFIPQDAFRITAIGADGSITGAQFFETVERGGVSYTKCEEHSITDAGYIIRNRIHTENGTAANLGAVPEWADLEPEVRLEGVYRPLFAYFRMPFINPADIGAPLGAPVYTRATQLIADAEKQYRRLLWEFESGERALYLDETAVRRGKQGEAMLPERRLYRLLNTGNDELFCDWTPEFRDEALINGLERILQRIEFNCGLAYGTLSDPQAVDKTAEEIRASKQRSYATVTQIQSAMKDAFDAWLYAAEVLCDIYMLAPEGECRLNVVFDDSIIADRTVEFSERMELLREGVITKQEMRRWYLGEEKSE